MKNILTLFSLFVFCILLHSCNQDKNSQQTNKIIITGKIHNYEGDSTKLFFIYSQPGTSNFHEPIKVDKLGDFKYQIESSISLDAKIIEKKTFANINFIYHPGDSIHLEFETKNKSLHLLKTVKFSGSRAVTNNQLIKFQILREENNLGYGAIQISKSYKKNINSFIAKMEELKEKQLNIYNEFVISFSPSDEVKIWTKLFALETYYYFLDDYSFGKSNLPKNYFDYNKQILPITIDKLISWQILSSRINSYWRNNTKPKIVEQFSNKMDEIKNGKINTDSLVINYINNSYDNLHAQVLLARYYTIQFEANIVDGYQRNQLLLDSSIEAFFIKKALNKKYQTTYNFINKPNEFTNEVLKKIENTPIEKTFTKILSENKGKIIYLDCWATWCSPCIRAMPDSKKLMKKFEGKGVSFVYVCIESREKLWKKLISEFNLGGGQHYLLDKGQSEFFRNAMNIQGIPEYILINQEGNIVEQGAHIDPGGELIEKKIIQLLK